MSVSFEFHPCGEPARQTVMASAKPLTAVWLFAILRHPPLHALPHPDKLVLVKLADNAHADGHCARPSIRTIARQCDLSERAAQNALRRLQAAGVIAEEKPATATSPTTYRIVLEMLPAKG